MAHFALLDKNNVVLRVESISNNVFKNEVEGVVFLRSLYGQDNNFKQTSYNGSFRKNYAGIGYAYDAARDAFIAPQPFLSWVMNEQTCQWGAPVPMPTDGKMYSWDEATLNWIESV